MGVKRSVCSDADGVFTRGHSGRRTSLSLMAAAVRKARDLLLPVTELPCWLPSISSCCFLSLRHSWYLPPRFLPLPGQLCWFPTLEWAHAVLPFRGLAYLANSSRLQLHTLSHPCGGGQQPYLAGWFPPTWDPFVYPGFHSADCVKRILF